MEKNDLIKTIHVLPYSHHDHAWTNTRQWHMWRYIEWFCQVLDLMKVNDQYTIAIDNILHSLDVFYQFCPSRVDELVDRVKEGRISIANGGMALARPADYDGELMIRNGAKGKKELMDRFGLEDIPLYFNADTACGTSQMPQIISLLGHRYYRFMRPEETLRKMGVPFHFIWRGLDGSEVLVARGEYGACLFCEWDNLDGESWEVRRDAFIKEELANKLDCIMTDQLLLNVGQDDCLPNLSIRDRPFRLEELMQEWNAKEASQMVYSTFNRFFQEVSKQDVPVWEGVLDACDLSFNAPIRVDASLRKARLLCERLLLVCEKLDVMLVQMGGRSTVNKIEKLWGRLFQFAGHAMQHLLNDDYVLARDGALATISLLVEHKNKLMNEIAIRSGKIGKVSQVLFNPSIHNDNQVVELHVTTPHHIDGLELTDTEGNVLPWQLVEVLNGDKPYDRQFNEVRVVTKLQVPPLGYTSVAVQCDGKTMAPPEVIIDTHGYVIDNGVFRAHIHNGMIDCIELDGGGIVDNRPMAMPYFVETEPTETWLAEWKPITSHKLSVSKATLVECGPIRWKLVTEGMIGSSSVTLVQTIESNSPLIKYQMILDNRENEGYFAIDMPCNTTADLHCGIPFGEEMRDPDHEIYHKEGSPITFLRYERGWENAFYANGYASFRSGAGRLLLLQGDCSNMMRLDRERNAITELLFRSVDMSTKKEEWMTHVCKDMNGKGLQNFEFAIAVTPSEHDSRLAHALLQSQRAPIISQPRYSIEEGSAPPTGQVLSIDSEHVEASALFYQNESISLRLYETGGIEGKTQIRLPSGFNGIEFVDFTGKALDRKFTAEKDRFTFDIRPWEIVTIRFSKA